MRLPGLLSIIFALFLGSITVKAQDGCLVERKLYTNYTTLLGLTRLYTESAPISLSVNQCWSSSSTVSCNVCFGGLNAAGLLCIGEVKSGQRGVYSIVQCNLDDYSWVLGASAAALGLIVIRKRKFH